MYSLSPNRIRPFCSALVTCSGGRFSRNQYCRANSDYKPGIEDNAAITALCALCTWPTASADSSTSHSTRLSCKPGTSPIIAPNKDATPPIALLWPSRVGCCDEAAVCSCCLERTRIKAYRKVFCSRAESLAMRDLHLRNDP